ncbi:MAG: single-stranded DNA-binding protein [Brevibacterium sp.]
MNEQPRDPDPELGRAFYGFVASNPQPSGSGGTKRLYFKAGQEHYEYGPDGSRTKLPTTFHDVVAFKGAAIGGDAKLAKGDWFLAIGRLQTSTNPNTGIESTEFIVSRFGHDLARMNTEIGTPRRLSQMESPNHQQPARQVAFEPPEQRQPEHEQPARAM